MWDSFKCVPRASAAEVVGNEFEPHFAPEKPSRSPLSRFAPSLGRGPDAPSCTTSPNGFALSEILLVLAICGLVLGILAIAGLVDVDQPSDQEQKAVHDALRREAEIIEGQEVPLGDEFVCTVRLLAQVTPGPRPQEYLSRIRIACRDPGQSEVFLLEITKSASPDRSGRWQTWNLMSPAALQDRLLDRRKAVVGSIYVTEQELSTGNTYFETPVVQRVTGLEELFVRLVPPHLQETGVLVMSNAGRLHHGVAIDGFPLDRLAASIRSALRIDAWEEGDLHSLLTRDKAGTRRLTEDQRHAIARWLVHRLLDDLPQE
jgi:hypothetical protein